MTFEPEGRTSIPGRWLQPADVAPVAINCLRWPRTTEAAEIDIRPMMRI
jgi:hypothetical protein